MKIVRTLLAPACVTLLLSACEPQAEAEPPLSESDPQALGWSSDADPGRRFDIAAQWLCALPKARGCSDGQVAAIAIAANAGEVLVSEAVLERLESPAVRELAEQLIVDHSRALSELQALLERTGITPVENDNSEHLAEMAQLMVEVFSTKSGEELEADFLSHQLAAHARTLGQLDHLLIPSTRERALAAHLRMQRAAVARHTLHTVEVQAAERGMCGGE